MIKLALKYCNFETQQIIWNWLYLAFYLYLNVKFQNMKTYLENLKSIDIQNPNILLLMIFYHGFINWLEGKIIPSLKYQ